MYVKHVYVKHVYVKVVHVKHVYVKHVYVKHVYVKHVYVKHVLFADGGPTNMSGESEEVTDEEGNKIRVKRKKKKRLSMNDAVSRFSNIRNVISKKCNYNK